MADSRSRGFEAQEQKLQDKLDKLQSRYDNAREILEQQGGVMDTSRVRGVEILQSKIDEVKQQLKNLRKARGDVPKLPPPTTVKPHPGLDRKDVELFKDPDSSKPPMPKNRPAIVDTPSKKRPAPSKKRRNRRYPIQEAACQTYYGGIG
jgi:hypothetical protein